jgi:hypothetical protein
MARGLRQGLYPRSTAARLVRREGHDYLCATCVLFRGIADAMGVLVQRLGAVRLDIARTLGQLSGISVNAGLVGYMRCLEHASHCDF